MKQKPVSVDDLSEESIQKLKDYYRTAARIGAYILRTYWDHGVTTNGIAFLEKYNSTAFNPVEKTIPFNGSLYLYMHDYAPHFLLTSLGEMHLPLVSFCGQTDDWSPIFEKVQDRLALKVLELRGNPPSFKKLKGSSFSGANSEVLDKSMKDALWLQPNARIIGQKGTYFLITKDLNGAPMPQINAKILDKSIQYFLREEHHKNKELNHWDEVHALWEIVRPSQKDVADVLGGNILKQEFPDMLTGWNSTTKSEFNDVRQKFDEQITKERQRRR